MANTDKKNYTQATMALNAPQATVSGAATVEGNVVDTLEFQAITVAFYSGSVTSAGAGVTFTLQESDTTADADFTNVAVIDLLLDNVDTPQTLTTISANEVVITIGYRGEKRYVRPIITGSAGVNAVFGGVVFKQAPELAEPISTADRITAT